MDDSRFDDFYRREYARAVTAVALVTGSVAEAQDAVDEALARAWEQERRERGPDSLAAWVRVVALNLARGRLRRRGVEQRARARLTTVAVVDPEMEVALDVRTALAQLSRRQREVAVLHYFYDLPVAQVASELALSEGTVKSMLHRARVALAASLTEEVPDDVQA
jgi:RNA polymerase sigma-70 factor (ECF subfamily)